MLLILIILANHFAANAISKSESKEKQQQQQQALLPKLGKGITIKSPYFQWLNDCKESISSTPFIKKYTTDKGIFFLRKINSSYF